MKKKLDALVKRIDVFEKLAVYGDRSTFLKALAQDTLDPKTKSILNEMSRLLQQAGITDEEVWNPLNSALVFGHVDLPAIRQAVTRAAVRNPSIANSDATAKLYQLAQQLISGPSPTTNDETETVPVAPAKKEVPPAKPSVQYPTISPEEQRALGKILTVKGLGLPLDADGILGPKTRAALDAVKKLFKNRLKTFTDREALSFVKMLAETPEYNSPTTTYNESGRFDPTEI